MPTQHFRAGVVIVVRSPDHRRVLAVERVDTPGSWQLPQGGLHEGEQPDEAAWRELDEETGLGPPDVELVAEYPEWLVSEYSDDIRAKYHLRRGQAHKWLLFDARSDDPPVRCDGDEIAAWRWVDPRWLIEAVVDFRRPSYARVLATLADDAGR